MRQIAVAALDDIAHGATVLDTSGGDPYIGKLMAQGTLRRWGNVELIDPLELDDDLVAPTGMIGTMMVMVEKVPAEPRSLALSRRWKFS
jgi:uncharacterized protein